MVVMYNVREMNKEWEKIVEEVNKWGPDYAASVIAKKFGLGGFYNWAKNRKR
ncbi:MAG: hypothetical protein QXK48_00725 [Candidatus Aenigmatarchaeota archaeon]